MNKTKALKPLIVIFILLVTISLNAQDKIERTIGEFKEVKVFDLIEVELIQSDEDKVVVTGKNTEHVSIINKNGKLKIRMKLGKRFSGNNTTVALYYTNIDVIDANEGAVIFSENKIKQFEIDLKTQEGGKIDVPVDVKFLNIKAVTGGIVTVKGNAEREKIIVNTGGICNAKELDSENARVAIKAGGEVEVKASELVDINIRAGGDVYVFGNPKSVKENRALGGRVKIMNKEQ